MIKIKPPNKKNLLEGSILGIVLILAIVGMIASHKNLQWYEGVYVREDGFIESCTAAILLFGSFLCLFRFNKIKHGKCSLFSLMTLILAGLFFFGAGEEISWGQRVFGHESPEFFQSHNSQKETNLHNLILDGKKINKIIFGTFLGIVVSLYLVVLPIIYKKEGKIKYLMDKLAIPIPQNRHVVYYFILLIIVTMVSSPKKGELLEFGGCFIFYFIVLNPLNNHIYQNTLSKSP